MDGALVPPHHPITLIAALESSQCHLEFLGAIYIIFCSSRSQLIKLWVMIP